MNKFIKGQRVKFLDEQGGGVIIKVKPGGLLMVSTDDGFEYTIPEGKLLVADSETPNGPAEYERAGDDVKDNGYSKKRPKTPAKTEEVDLHIKELTDNYSGLRPGEIVELQVARFRIALEGAIRSGQKRIVFIHGRGSGKLKREIQKIIDSEYPGCIYKDASYRQYGLGATTVIIR